MSDLNPTQITNPAAGLATPNPVAEFSANTTPATDQERAQAMEQASDQAKVTGQELTTTAVNTAQINSQAPQSQGQQDQTHKPDPALQPLTDPTALSLSYPEGITVDKTVEADFATFCVRSGLSPNQAQALADWQIQAHGQALQNLMDEGEKTLHAKWGMKTETNRQAALSTLAALDRRMEGRLSPALAKVGAGLMPEVVEAFHLLSTLMAEDSLGSSTTGTAPVARETPEQAYAEMFK